MSPYIRTVKTGSGARAVQVVHSKKHGSKKITHVGSAHTDREYALLKAQAQRIIDGDQMSLDLGVAASGDAGVGSENNPVPVTAERAGILLDCIDTCFNRIGLDAACGGDTVFRDLVRARIIHPGSKLESIETLADVGVTSAGYATIKRKLPEYATDGFREIITQALATHAGIGPGSFLLYDVTTLYFETDTPDDLRKPGFSKERRIEPQILVGLLTDSSGFPLSVGAFEGNKAETHTMLPMIRRMQEAYRLSDVTIVADAGMFSAANKKAIVDSGLHYILSVKTPNLPEVITEWKKDNPGEEYEHGQVWRQPSFTDGRKSGAPDSVTFYHYSKDRARRTLRGINEQLDKASVSSCLCVGLVTCICRSGLGRRPPFG